MRQHRAAVIAGIVGVALAALIALFAFSPKGEDPAESASSPLVGKLAPALAGSTADGQAFDLDQHRGQWVLVNFFATWCPPCVAEHPLLVQLSEQTQGSLQVVSVASGDTADNVVDFFEKRGGDWPVLVSDTDDASIDYGLIKLPESYLIAPDGTVVQKLVGGIDEGEVAAIERRIAEGTGSGAAAGSGS
ncbi:TlpA family protein disulfide reductase [Dermatobacter hominis]|uniref:TlpA family protein disulfide reductase n=1 Tax=Dermatobacter hominis TaxID=2884263 RepID=UPI001D108D58|nr:TlpA disulfide reductase family protein [Dermatobacter hominis]UDY37283.1 TlpA family protein disulfide reductase [Dermatobacter hominis]